LCRNENCELKQRLRRLREEQPPADTDPGSHAFREFQKEAQTMGERLYGSFDPDAALVRLRERGDMDSEMDDVEQLQQLMLRMQIRPIHSISGIWLQKHQLLLGATNAAEATGAKARLDESDKYTVEQCSEEQTQIYNPMQLPAQPLPEAVPPSRAERERMKQRQQKRTARTKPGEASRTRRHFDPIPRVQHKREYHSDTPNPSDSMGGAEPDEEDLEIAMVSRPAKNLSVLELDR